MTETMKVLALQELPAVEPLDAEKPGLNSEFECGVTCTSSCDLTCGPKSCGRTAP